MEAGGDKLHIVVFPWLAFGHMLPFLELSKSLAKRGHLISFVSTPKNIQRFPNLPPQISPLINFIPLSLPKVEGMPGDVEATTDLPPANLQYLKKALDGLEQPFRSFLREASPKPDWIIQDLLQHWIPPIAAELHVPSMYFGTVPAAALTFFGHPSQLSSRGKGLEGWLASPPWVPFPSKVAYRLHELIVMAKDAAGPLHSGMTDARRMEAAIVGCCAVAIRTCRELESEWLPILEEIYGKPVIPVGLLLPTADESTDGNSIIDWLGTRSQESVVYIALGSEVSIGVELIHELALGLELAGLPFLWALRRPYGLSSDTEILPGGFEERTRGYGKVVMGWVPQMRVLADGSVGGFVTHCGWSSVVESLHFGHPLVLLPIFGDQGLNARLLEEKGIGVEVERKGDASFTRNEVAKAVNLVMVEGDGSGSSYRKKAKEMKKIFGDKECQEKYVDEFIQFLLSNGTAKG
nr:glucosyltransferase [Crocus sativus]